MNIAAINQIKFQWRGWRVSISFKALKVILTSIQARIRGFILRKCIDKAQIAMTMRYREHLFKLWKIFHVPLLNRTLFWKSANKRNSFFILTFLENEILYYWRSAGLKTSFPKNNRFRSKCAIPSKVWAIIDEVHSKICLIIVYMLIYNCMQIF